MGLNLGSPDCREDGFGSFLPKMLIRSLVLKNMSTFEDAHDSSKMLMILKIRRTSASAAVTKNGGSIDRPL
jgi:hypothetical protein